MNKILSLAVIVSATLTSCSFFENKKPESKVFYLLKFGDTIENAISFSDRSHLCLMIGDRFDIFGNENTTWVSNFKGAPRFYETLEDKLISTGDSVFIEEEYSIKRDESFKEIKTLMREKTFLCTLDENRIANKNQLLESLNKLNYPKFKGKKITEIIISDSK